MPKSFIIAFVLLVFLAIMSVVETLLLSGDPDGWYFGIFVVVIGIIFNLDGADKK